MSDQFEPGKNNSTPAEALSNLPLREAILAWCDPVLITELQAAERKLTFDEHAVMDLALLSERSTLGKRRDFKAADSADFEQIRAAWRRLLQDLRSRVERGELFLEGVRLAPERGTTPEEISNTWAADLTFDVVRNTIKIGRDRFGAVTISTYASPWQAVLERSATLPRRLAVEDVEGLDSDVIIALINEHARRVVATHGSELLSPGKISPSGIVMLKLEERIMEGPLLPTLAAEAEYLATWISQAAPSYQCPSSNRIARLIGPRYSEWKARSNAAIHKASR